MCLLYSLLIYLKISIIHYITAQREYILFLFIKIDPKLHYIVGRG